MRAEKYLDFERRVDNVSGLFSIAGNFGIIDGKNQIDKLLRTDKGYSYQNDQIKLEAEFTYFENGAILRADKFTNVSDSPIILRRAFSRFALEGAGYEVYTQYNNWQHESTGAWSTLNTQVSATSSGIRSCQGATPMMALYNKQSGKTLVFHLFANAQWKMTASRFSIGGKNDAVTVECGFEDSALALTVAPQETISLPEILFFEAEDRRDLDAYKLHEVFNELYPRKSLPLMYNTWLLEFDNIKVDNILRQVDAAAELGIEYFVIDAGWFGTKPNWDQCIGEWSENMTGGFCGRVSEISEYVRSKGMIFGMWLEPERALPHTESVKAHPDYYIHNEFLNFANDEARKYIFDITCGLIEKYHLGYMKFDFNNSFAYDLSAEAFYRYTEGQTKYVKDLKERYPDLYLTNCASGGFRMQPEQAKYFDSFWVSDNQGPYEGLNIYKDTALRMPCSCIEKWNVQTFCEGFPEYQKTELRTLPISCNNATWDYVLNVKEDYTFCFLSGGPIGFSCNIADFPADYFERLKVFLAKYKKERDFYSKASLRLLCDTDNVIVLEYADKAFHTVVIHAFTKLVYQDRLTVYPVLDTEKSYRIGDTVYSGKELAEDGICLKALQDNDAQSIVLQAK